MTMVVYIIIMISVNIIKFSKSGGASGITPQNMKFPSDFGILPIHFLNLRSNFVL